MEKSRNLVVGIGFLILLFMGWIAWVTFKSPITSQSTEVTLPKSDMEQLKEDLSDFIVERLKKERPNSEFKDISLQMPVEDQGVLKVAYVLTFHDPKAQVDSSISAVALLEKAGAQWKVTKVVPQKETITYDQNAFVKSGAEANAETSDEAQKTQGYK